MRKVLITAIVIVSLILAAIMGFLWYQSTHFFVEDAAYPKNAKELDLRGEGISEHHYLTVQSRLPDCEILWDVSFQGDLYSSDIAEMTVTSLSDEDVRILKSYFPNLKQIHAESCREYDLLGTLAEQMPDCKVSYLVDLGGTQVSPDAKEITLEQGGYDFNVMMNNLFYLPELKNIYFPNTDLTTQQTEELAQAYPDIAVSQTVEILGKEYDAQTTVLDLSTLAVSDVDEVAAKLGTLPHLSEVQLANHLALKDVQKLKLAVPDVKFQYSFDFYGVAVSTQDKEVILKRMDVKAMPEGGIADELRAMLDVMSDCDRVVVEGLSQYDKVWQKISSAELAKIREEYRDKTKLVWRVYFGENGSSLTDAQVLRAVYGLTDDNSHDLIYCENVRYLDLGHNEFLDYAEFLSGMKDLEVAILSGAPLKSLDPIAACKNLKFLEIANCLYLPDINALKECTQLEMLNISFTKFEDISALNDLNLTHLTTVKNALVTRDGPVDALQAFIDGHPDCWVVHEGEQPYGEGWRYNEEGKHLPWYEKMVSAFHYPNPYNNIGWYLEEK